MPIVMWSSLMKNPQAAKQSQSKIGQLHIIADFT